jgi:sucrose-6-phosphate hydrolase SacC (GH32 family)
MTAAAALFQSGIPMIRKLFAVSVTVLLATAAEASDKTAVSDKTLVVWAAPANLTQRGGSALTLENPGGVFDAIVLGEIAPGKWMAGSNNFARTEKDQQAAAETADAKTVVQIAVVYKGRQVTIYRDGKKYADYPVKKAEQFGDDSFVLMGLRHLDAGPGGRYFVGAIEDARIYGQPLSARQVAALKPHQLSEVKPLAWWHFADGRIADRMGRFPATTLFGDARVSDGKLLVEKAGAYLLASRATPHAGPGLNKPATVARSLREKLLSDSYRPGYHFVTPEGRCMPFDPNGAIFWKGRYHLFYIFQDARGHNWGHVSSTDLCHWRHHPTDLVSGMFSGNCFINKDGRPTICHHQVGLGNAMLVALDDDLNKWKRLPSNPITPKTRPGDPHHGKYRSWDPFGWLEGDTYYAIFGGERPAVARSRSLEGPWTYAGDLFAHAAPGVGINEDVSCADFFKIGNGKAQTHMLLCISHRLGCRYYLGDWKNEQFHPRFHERMSWVDNSFFAPRSLLDDKGRRIMWAWIFDAPGFGTRTDNGWSGTMSLPRVLTLADDGTLRMNPAAELEKLRYRRRKHAQVEIPDGGDIVLGDIAGNSLELDIELTTGSAREVGVKVCRSTRAEEETRIFYDAAAKKLKIDTTKSTLGEGPRTVEAAPFRLGESERLRLRIFVDRSVVEVFANGGRQAVMRRIYPSRKDSVGVSVFATGGPARATTIQAWDLSPSNPY